GAQATAPTSQKQNTTAVETKTPPATEGQLAPGATQAPVDDAASDHQFGLGISLSPALKRSSEVRYDHITSSINKTTNHLDGFSLGLSLIYRPISLYGWRASAGLDFEAPREVWFTDRSGQAHKFEFTAASTYLAIGYQFWRIYADLGMQFPLYFQKEWQTFNVETVAGGKLNLGIEVT